MDVSDSDSVFRKVWVTDGTHEEKEESQEKWTKVHDAVTHPPSTPITPDSLHQTRSKSGQMCTMRWEIISSAKSFCPLASNNKS